MNPTLEAEAPASAAASAPAISILKRASDQAMTIRTWLERHPTIKIESDARDAGDQMLITRVMIRELHDEQQIEATPIKNQIDALKPQLDRVRDKFAKASEPLVKLNLTLNERVQAYMATEEQKTGAPVQIKTEAGKAIKLKDAEVLTVTDACAAINTVGLTDDIRDAIIAAAEEYREAHGVLPPGVTSGTERVLGQRRT